MKEKISLKRISNTTERDIILLLKDKEKCMMGNILMNLKLSYKQGHQLLTSLLEKNWISNTEKAPYYTLNVEVD